MSTATDRRAGIHGTVLNLTQQRALAEFEAVMGVEPSPWVIVTRDTYEPLCGDHGQDEPTCDICERGQCFTPQMPWNGETGNHYECEATP